MARSVPLFFALTLALASACADESLETGPGGSGSGGGPAEEPEVFLDPEAGFVDLPPAAQGSSFPSRVFYSFWPAEHHAERAPVLLYFNGGPGSATTSVLLPYGTAPFTLDPDAPAGTPPAPNPVSHTRFANLLYIDARGTGFSYDVGGVGCEEGPDTPAADAGDMVFALLAFLDRQPALIDNPVVLVGESYGGTRSVLMLTLLQHHAALPPPDGGHDFAATLPWLPARVHEHLTKAFPDVPEHAWTPDEVAEQFGAQILIQPNIFGGAQFDAQVPLIQADPDLADKALEPSTWDSYDVRRTEEEGVALFEAAGVAMRDPSFFPSFFGVEAAAIAGLSAADRGDAARAFGTFDPAAVAASEGELRERLGALDADDAYWLPQSNPCGGYLGDISTLTQFVEQLPRTRTFITDARYDAVVYSDVIPTFLATAPSLKVAVDRSAPAGAARPGQFTVSGPGGDATVRFPQYEAGHEVTIGAPAAFAEDVEAWLVEAGLVTP